MREEIAAPAAAVPALALAAAPEIEERAVEARVSRPARSAKRISPAAAPPAGTDSPVIEKIVAVLAKGPRTSGELMQVTGYSSGSVYPALKVLRDAGRVEMVADGSDGLRKNKLIERG